MGLRIVERFNRGIWEVIRMKDIKAGDRFRMKENDGPLEEYITDDNGKTEFIALSDAEIINDVYGVKAEGI